MKIIYTLFLCLTLNFATAQYSPILKGKASCSRLMKSTTCVVLSDDETFNNAIKQAVKDNWDLTPIEFVSPEEFEATVSDTKRSFIYLNSFKIKGEKKEVGALALFNGGFTDTNFYLNSSLAYIAYDNWGLEKDITSFQERLPAMVFQLQTIIQIIYDNDISANNIAGITHQLNKVYAKKNGDLADKTILIDKRYETNKIASMQEFAKLYGFPFQLASSEEIGLAIKNKESNKAVLVSSCNLYKINKVFDCASYEILYVEIEMPDNLKSQNFNQFNNEDIQQLNFAVKKGK